MPEAAEYHGKWWFNGGFSWDTKPTKMVILMGLSENVGYIPNEITI